MTEFDAGGGCMKFFDKVKNLFQGPQQASESQEDGKQQTKFRRVWNWIYKFRSVFLAIPVAVAAIILAITNAAKLPEKVMLYIPSVEQKEVLVKLVEMDRGTAIFVPLLVTLFCLLMVFCSRRVLYPWLISIFSLVLPLFLMFTSVFPG